jgi:CelD/BcsL family acetyltransferase involved in cellulose biosynthesis
MSVSETAAPISLLEGFDDPALSDETWMDLLERGATHAVFLTPEWQRAWWETFGRDRLLLLLAAGAERISALAPLFVDEDGMVYFVGSGGSDYLDFLGDSGDPRILAGLLETARAVAPRFAGFRLHHVPESSPTTKALPGAAKIAGLSCECECSMIAPALELGRDPAVPQRKSLVRHQNFFSNNGILEVSHFRNATEIVPQLEEFFAQHVARWNATGHPSLFLKRSRRCFYRRVAQLASGSGWLRFTRVDWNGHAIAFHFGFSYDGVYVWYKPSFDIALARRSPGEVLLRQLFLAASSEGAHTFDFGIGDEAFKNRFATRRERVHTWTLLPERR